MSLEGYLQKQGVGSLGKGFKKRYFKEKDGSLFYYRGKSDSSALGSINITEAIRADRFDTKDGKFHFKIYTPTRIWHLSADSEDNLRYWLNGINGIINKTKKEMEIQTGGVRQSVRWQTMENRIRDLESRDDLLKKALQIAADKAGVSVDILLSMAEKETESTPESVKEKPVAAVVSESAASTATSTSAPEPEPKKVEVEVKKEEEKKEDSGSEEEDEEFAEKGDDNQEKPKRFRAKVLYDYTAQQDYEMTIRVNEVITVLSKHGNGWWLGATGDGKQGYFPGSYVEPIQ